LKPYHEGELLVQRAGWRSLLKRSKMEKSLLTQSLKRHQVYRAATNAHFCSVDAQQNALGISAVPGHWLCPRQSIHKRLMLI